MPDNKKLSKAQERAVSHVKGPALVIAGPGSGKTTVITQRIGNLITYHGISPEHILVITFTKAAAKEMKDRTMALLGQRAGQIAFGTFHSVFFQMLKTSRGIQGQSVIAEWEKHQYLRESLRYCGIRDIESSMEAELLSEISMAKCMPDTVREPVGRQVSEEAFAAVSTYYNKLLRQNGKFDFDDMITECFHMLREDEHCRRFWQKRFHYILIDEYQDVNRMQAETVKLLLGKERNLFVVGDDDQAIYGFRGADPTVMLRFPQEYPDAVTILLGDNYRSDRNIVEAAGRLIEQNHVRFQKEITAVKGAEHPVMTACFEDGQKEYHALAEWCRSHPEDCRNAAVIVRTNHDLARIAGVLSREHIAYRARERISSVYDVFPGNNIAIYLKIAAGMQERELFYGIMNKPLRYLSRNAISEDDVFCSMRRYYREDKRMLSVVDAFEKEICFLQKLRPYAALQYILKGMKYEEYVKNYCREHGICEEDAFGDISQLAEDARNCQSVEEWVKEFSGVEKAVRKKAQDEEGIWLVTMHGSKGLEYEVVFLTDVNEGITPYHQAKSDAQREEERRVFYVAATRAKKQLHLWYVKNLRGKEMLPSTFLEPFLMHSV